MSLQLDYDLTDDEKGALRDIPAASWFTQVIWRNAASPRHPRAEELDPNNELKQALVGDWVEQHVRGKRVLDLFCANGAFSFLAAMAGASAVVGLDFSPERVECARFVAQTLAGRAPCLPTFQAADVYQLAGQFDRPFDVVLCLGGLYHMADPPFILSQVRALTAGLLIVQTSSIMLRRGNWAQFCIRSDQTHEGLTSIVGERGAWHFTVECFESFLRHARFRVLESRRPPEPQRKRFPWYCALAEPV